MEAEVWKAVPKYDGYYEVSDQGRVRSVHRRVRRADAKGGGTQLCRGRILVPRKGLSRYARASVQLAKHGVSKSYLIHRLVMQAFVGPVPTGCEVNHRNGDSSDNSLGNLEYCTHRENAIHAFRMNLISPPRYRGHLHPNSRLCEADVRRIRRLLAAGSRLVALSREYGVSTSLIWRIKNRKVWCHI